MSKKILVDTVEPLIEDMNGNIAAIARKLGVSRNTVYSRIAESATLQRKLKDARETMVDNAESALYRAVLDGNMTAIIFFLKTQGKDRGYTERNELTGAGGGPIAIKGYMSVSPDDWPDETE